MHQSSSSSDVAVPGGDSKQDMTDNIDLTQLTAVETESVTGENSDNDIQDAQDNTVPLPRRSERIHKQTGEWWGAPSSLLTEALLVKEESTSFKVANPRENISFFATRD